MYDFIKLSSLRSKRSRTERTKFGPCEGVFALGPREKRGETRISFARTGTLATQATNYLIETFSSFFFLQYHK